MVLQLTQEILNQKSIRNQIIELRVIKMTMIRGVRIRATPCCGKLYASPNYLSMNFMAAGFWTDGWRENSLMPNESGLRQCACGEFLKLKDMTDIREEEKSDLPRMEHIPGELLLDCIKQCKDEDMEILARFAYWRFANHEYREIYKAHRDAEELQNKLIWDNSQKELQSWWKRALCFSTPEYARSVTSTFTVPLFEPSDEQMDNMTQLSEKILAAQKSSQRKNALNLAELYRELGRFEEAKFQINQIPDHELGTSSKIIDEHIEKQESALIRFRM